MGRGGGVMGRGGGGGCMEQTSEDFRFQKTKHVAITT